MTTVISPAVGHALSFTQGGVGTSPGYDAVDRRRAFGHAFREGVLSAPAWKVTESAAPAMSVLIDADVTGGYIQGDSVTDQGLYYCAPHSANITETITASDPTNPRVDRVVLEAKDNAHDASGLNEARTRVVNGTATAGATLQNENGIAAMPISAILLATVLVPALSTTVVNANIRDWRTYARREGTIGELAATARSTAPDGWKLCDGSTLNRTVYSELFAAISTTYGTGDGSTTFTLPDLRGRTPVGVDGAAGRLPSSDALGNSGGEARHLLTTSETPSHSHADGTLSSASDGAHTHTDTFAVSNFAFVNTIPYSTGSGWSGVQATGTGAGVAFPTPDSAGAAGINGSTLTHNHALTGSVSSGGAHTHDITGSTATAGGGTDHNIMQPYQIVNWMIYTGLVV